MNHSAPGAAACLHNQPLVQVIKGNLRLPSAASCPVIEIQVLAAGTGIALAGVFAYSQVKRLSSKQKVATA